MDALRGGDISDITGITVAQLIVRGLDDLIIRKLKQRAARNGRSAEAEHREILATVLLAKARGGIKSHLRGMPDAGDDADFEVPRGHGRNVEL